MSVAHMVGLMGRESSKRTFSKMSDDDWGDEPKRAAPTVIETCLVVREFIPGSCGCGHATFRHALVQTATTS